MNEEFDPLFPVRIGCPIHGQFMITPLEHLVGYGCPMCDKENPEALKEKLLNTFSKLMSE